MRKFIFTILLSLPVLSVSSVYAGNMCLKVYGTTPEKAFQAGAEQLAEADIDAEGRIKEDMQIHLLPKKEKGFFVAIVYSVHHQKICDVVLPKTADAAESKKCDASMCSI
ncbi:MAG: hypothetical protein ACL93V_00075 [Candidatus Electrothrix sp. YB6]